MTIEYYGAHQEIKHNDEPYRTLRKFLESDDPPLYEGVELPKGLFFNLAGEYRSRRASVLGDARNFSLIRIEDKKCSDLIQEKPIIINIFNKTPEDVKKTSKSIDDFFGTTLSKKEIEKIEQ